MMTKPHYSKNHCSTVSWMPYDNVDYFNRQQAKLARGATVDHVPTSKRVAGSTRSQAPGSHASQVPPASNRTTSTEMSVPGMFSKGLANRSSVKHNIITGDNNVFSCEMKPGILDAQIFNRKKGITEFRDLMGKANKNMDHVAALSENQGTFKKQNGIFTHLYNAAARFGETEVFKT
jgi:hypothetical protein